MASKSNSMNNKNTHAIYHGVLFNHCKILLYEMNTSRPKFGENQLIDKHSHMQIRSLTLTQNKTGDNGRVISTSW